MKRQRFAARNAPRGMSFKLSNLAPSACFGSLMGRSIAPILSRRRPLLEFSRLPVLPKLLEGLAIAILGTFAMKHAIGRDGGVGVTERAVDCRTVVTQLSDISDRRHVRAPADN